MNTQAILGIAAFLMSTGISTGIGTPTQAANLNPILSENQTRVSGRSGSHEMILADISNRERHQRHEELERTLQWEMNYGRSRTLPQAEKERIVREAHEELDRSLDRENDRNGRNDRNNRDDRDDRDDRHGSRYDQDGQWRNRDRDEWQRDHDDQDRYHRNRGNRNWDDQDRYDRNDREYRNEDRDEDEYWR